MTGLDFIVSLHYYLRYVLAENIQLKGGDYILLNDKWHSTTYYLDHNNEPKALVVDEDTIAEWESAMADVTIEPLY